MKTICLFLKVHQPIHLKRYRLFDIGIDHYYYDDYLNESMLKKMVQQCYLPTNELLLSLIEQNRSQFNISLSLSGVLLDQLQLYAPEAIESFSKLARSGCVEFLAETYSHSLASIASRDEFQKQVNLHSKRIEQLFGQKPRIFNNTEMIYSDTIGKDIYEMGYEGILTEGAHHILQWRSPNHLYCNSVAPHLPILTRNTGLSDDIALRFGDKSWKEYPLTCEKFTSWLNGLGPQEKCVNLFMAYETFGKHNSSPSDIMNFLSHLPSIIMGKSDFRFATPSQVINQHNPCGSLDVPNPISWCGEEKDLSHYLGNEIQLEAFNKLYKLRDKVNKVNDPKIQKDWLYLQCSDHFNYMSTKFISADEFTNHDTPYHSPYDAFINYMNILGDFKQRVYQQCGTPPPSKQVHLLKKQLIEKEEQLQRANNKLKLLQKNHRKQNKQIASQRKALRERDSQKELIHTPEPQNT